MAGQKPPERAGRNIGVRVWIFAGLLVLFFLQGSLAWHFAGLRPASFSPAKSPAKQSEQATMQCVVQCVFQCILQCVLHLRSLFGRLKDERPTSIGLFFALV